MLHIIKSLIVATLLLLPTTGFSAWTQFYPIKHIYAHGNGNIYVMLEPGSSHSNPAGCPSTYWVSVSRDLTNHDGVYKLLLTAQASGMKVQLGIDGCVGSYPQILHAVTKQ